MAFNKKYAGLPDLDLAPDIYETPELTDDSTLPTATVRSSSPFEPDTSFNPEIDGRRLRVDEARSHFEPARVDARDVDFSDSIASKRKSYRTLAGKRRQKQENGTEVLGDISDEEDETLERKLARLRREAEELKEDLANRKAQRDRRETREQDADNVEDTDNGILELSRALDILHASSGEAGSNHLSAEELLSQKLSAGMTSKDLKKGDGKTLPLSHSTEGTSGTLSHAASFDTRLNLLESALGLPNTPVPISPDDPSNTDIQPVLPALNHLASQLSTLSSTLITGPSSSSTSASASLPPSMSTTTTTPHIEALSSRIRKLTADAEALTSARQRAADAARAAFTARITTTSTTDEQHHQQSQQQSDPTISASAAIESDAAANEQAAKIQALYTTLPTITSLHPLLPSVLERLRSLRAIHAGAASASEDLDALEKRQADMKKEIDQWREGLKVMEERVQESESSMKGNMEVMGPWVKDLEKRLGALEG